jgi:1,4-alpha-glucan branching enzyme
MSSKKLGIVVAAHLPYVRHLCEEGELPGPEYDLLFTSISQTYLPLVNLIKKLEEEGVKSKFSIVMTPTLCAMLDDTEIQNQYVEWLDRCIALGQKEIERVGKDSAKLKIAQDTLKKLQQNKEDFTQKYNCNLLKQFAEFARKELIEILASCGSYAFLPHYADLPEVLNAQVETGIISHRNYFGIAPDGFWLPYQGYTKGLERVLRSYGILYTVLDSRGLLFAEDAPQTGIFAPVRTWNSLVIFANDSKACSEITGENAFLLNKVYKNQNRDIGFELEINELGDFVKPDSPRTNTLFRYWSNSEEIYDEQAALLQARKDAELYLKNRNETLVEAEKSVNAPSLICKIDARFLGGDWAEGMEFFETLLRKNADSEFVTPNELIEEQFKLTKVTPYPSAACGMGYGEDLLDSTNSWMLRYTRKMCERMVDLSDRFKDETGLKARLLILGAKELMLSQSAELSKMIHDGDLPDWAKNSFTQSVKNFTTVFDSLGTNLVSTEWLTVLEKEHNLFPWMNYRIFSRKM